MGASESVTPSLYPEAVAASRTASRAASSRLLQNVSTGIEIVADFLTCGFGILAAYFLAPSFSLSGATHYPMREAVAVSLSISFVAVLLLHRNGVSRGSRGLLQIRETERALRIPVQSVFIMLPLGILLNLKFFKGVFLLVLLLIPVLLILQKRALATFIRALHVRAQGEDRVIVYGIGETGKRILSALSHSPGVGLNPVAMIDDNPAFDGEWMYEMGYRQRRSVPVQRGPITSALLTSFQCRTLIVALSNLCSEQIAAAVDAANQAGVRVLFLSATELQEQKWTELIDIDGLSLAPMLEAFERWPYAIAKRMIDLAVASALLAMFAPFLLLIALLIRLDSPGPALFVQDRVGGKGELFKIYKFRSMQHGTPRYELSPTTPLDPRITRIGRFLRRNSLDELPQLFNVLLGDMSLVGPRPEMPFIVQFYTSEQWQRLQVTPGITGLWQLSGDRAFPIHENIEYDLYYIRNRGFFMDIAILIHTLFFAMRGGV